VNVTERAKYIFKDAIIVIFALSGGTKDFRKLEKLKNLRKTS
jgi:hypothetical protein